MVTLSRPSELPVHRLIISYVLRTLRLQPWPSYHTSLGMCKDDPACCRVSGRIRIPSVEERKLGGYWENSIISFAHKRSTCLPTSATSAARARLSSTSLGVVTKLPGRALASNAPKEGGNPLPNTGMPPSPAQNSYISSPFLCTCEVLVYWDTLRIHTSSRISFFYSTWLSRVSLIRLVPCEPLPPSQRLPVAEWRLVSTRF